MGASILIGKRARQQYVNVWKLIERKSEYQRNGKERGARIWARMLQSFIPASGSQVGHRERAPPAREPHHRSLDVGQRNSLWGVRLVSNDRPAFPRRSNANLSTSRSDNLAGSLRRSRGQSNRRVTLSGRSARAGLRDYRNVPFGGHSSPADSQRRASASEIRLRRRDSSFPFRVYTVPLSPIKHDRTIAIVEVASLETSNERKAWRWSNTECIAQGALNHTPLTDWERESSRPKSVSLSRAVYNHVQYQTVYKRLIKEA